MYNMKKQEFTKEQIEEARKARNAALRAWRKRNPEKVKAAQLRYYVKKAQIYKQEGELI